MLLAGIAWKSYWKKSRKGATLYLSVGSGYVRPFYDFTGLTVDTREKMIRTDIITLVGKRGEKV